MTTHQNFSDYITFEERAFALRNALMNELKKHGYANIGMHFVKMEMMDGELMDAVRFITADGKGNIEELDTIGRMWLEIPNFDEISKMVSFVIREIAVKMATRFEIDLDSVFLSNDEYALGDDMDYYQLIEATLIHSYQLPFENPILDTLLLLEDGMFYYDEQLKIYKQITVFDEYI